MAAHPNRSSSPLSSRPSNPTNPNNPNPRNSENNPSIRRSFSGNTSAKPSLLTNQRRFDPVTPANSPSDFARRRSAGSKEVKSCEEKENDEKDHNLMKPSKLQSPAKGSKNFMSPTISAASKFTPSPRKKVLVERSDPLRTSISLSDGKATFFSTTSPNVSSDFESKSEIDHPISKPPKRVTFSNVPSESLATDNDSDESLKFETSSKNLSSASPSIAPLDADPSLPPYDPKTNYLSPRPQFLHYRPNPRIGVLLNKEKGLDGDDFNPLLEDSFMANIMSENFSDSECTEESQTDSADMVIGLDDPEPSESPPVIISTIPNENLVRESEKKPRVVTLSRFVCFSVVTMLLVAFVSISVTPSSPLDKFAIKDLSLSDMSGNLYQRSRVAAYSARVSLDRLAMRVNEFSVNSLSFVSSLYNELGEGEKLGTLQFMNLSDLQKNVWNEANFLSNEIQEELVEDEEEDEDELEEFDSEMDVYEEGASYEEAGFDVILEEEFDTLESEYLEYIQIEGEAIGTVSTTNSSANHQLAVISQNQEIELDVVAEISADHQSADISLNQEIELDVVAKVSADHELADISLNQEIELDVAGKISADHQSADISQNQETKLDVVAEISADHESADILQNQEIELDVVAKNSADHQLADITQLDQESEVAVEVASLVEHESQSEISSSPYEKKFLKNYIMEISYLFAAAVLALTTLTTVLYKKYERISSSVNVVPSEEHNNSKSHHQEKAFSQNWQTEADEIGDESSCPSEMSSFQKTESFYNSSKKERKVGGASEVQSLEKNKARKYSSKRESLASSGSEFSPSYGSFTTFERIPIKLAGGDEEEIVTPVRRSSRIRNHYVTSP
ncbi:hypothetical protein ABFX02_02G047400 [Erythranthe guttata]